ncbi:hypothetical protein DPMN_116179 [Dreissena polymorpha]|uniref:Uncharacterized protein n=1 Tax=Dreissena polymorpha TaxID=45954 RepID=A0A9D4KML0_DREPO|nr:hypothetical protein DPMN_116179 [Dreissena polymorpha]
MLQVFPTQLEMYWYEIQVILACIGAIHSARKRTKGSIRKELGYRTRIPCFSTLSLLHAVPSAKTKGRH